MSFRIIKILSIVLVAPAALPLVFLFLAQDTRVCGIDGKSYPSQKNALENRVEISYDFPCQYPESEEGLFERASFIELTGMLREFYQKDNYIQVLISENSNQALYFAMSDSEMFDLSDYIPGDQVKIKGLLNHNTKLVQIKDIENLSIEESGLITDDCDFEDISREKIKCKSTSSLLDLKLEEKTIFAPFKKDDLALRIGDKIKIRHNDQSASIVILKQRGGDNYLLPKYFVVEGQYETYSQSTQMARIIFSLPTFTDTVSEGERKAHMVFLSLDTALQKKYFGKLKIEDFQRGDKIYMIAKKSSQNIEAVTIKNTSIWK